MQASLEDRLARLEHTQRRALIVMLVVVVAVASVALARQPDREVIRAHEFVLVDPATDEPVAVFTQRDDGTFLRIDDTGGSLELGVGDRPRVVGADRGGTQVDLFRPEVRPRPIPLSK